MSSAKTKIQTPKSVTWCNCESRRLRRSRRGVVVGSPAAVATFVRRRSWEWEHARLFRYFSALGS